MNIKYLYNYISYVVTFFDIDFISESQASLNTANTSVWLFARFLGISRITSGPHPGKYFVVNLEMNLLYFRLHGEALGSRNDYWCGNSGFDTAAKWEYHSIPLL